MTYDELVGKYIALRDMIKAEEAVFEAGIAPKKELLKKAELRMLDELNKMGADSIKTPYGTAYRAVRVSASVADREVFFNFIRKTDNFDLLTSHVSSDAVKVFIDANSEPPPGVNITQRAYVNIRRS